MSRQFGYSRQILTESSLWSLPLKTFKTQADSLLALAKLTETDSVNPLVRNTAIRIINDCVSRQDDCELDAIYSTIKDGNEEIAPFVKGFKYVADPRYADYFTSPADSITNCLKKACGGDCLPGETLVLSAGYKFKPIAEVRSGDVIMGDGQWVRVTNWWEKGRQDILEFGLNNGSTLRCTPEHRVFVVPKLRDRAGRRQEAYEVRASEIKPGDDLLVPERLPLGNETMEADRAWLLGLHIAEGWVENSSADGRPLRVGLSGLDGTRKEANKARALAYLASQNIATRWHEKYLSVNDDKTAAWLAGAGRGALAKHVPSLNWDEATLRQIRNGLDADADVRNGVFSTVSQTLALQYRVMLRMLGQSSHIRRVDDHGGFGKNPIYRVTPRAPDDDRRRFARVKSISEGSPTETYDIEVEGHRFYLPETDLVVHNCDDHCALMCALCASTGWKAGLRAWGPKNTGGYSHVYAEVAYPKRPSSKGFERVVGMDTTVAEAYVGWEPPEGNILTAWLT